MEHNLKQKKMSLFPDFETQQPTTSKNFTCRNCSHSQAWECNSKVFHYCEIQKSKRTSNGLLKIKLKNPACSLFSKI